MRIYTRKGDDGTTGLLYGGRVPKDSTLPEAYGTVDEAQAFVGLARAEVDRGSEVDELLVGVERDLWVLMAELATDPSNRHKLEPGRSLVTGAMVDALEDTIDEVSARFEPPTEFVVPGEDRLSALLDVARTVVRRAERAAIAAGGVPAGVAGEVAGEVAGDQPASYVVPYLNRLSDLLWTVARWQETTTRTARG